jgi:hypothetical protein
MKSALNKITNFFADHGFKIFIVTTISVAFLSIYSLAKREARDKKRYPLQVITHDRKWRTNGPIDEQGDWIIFTASDGRGIAVKGPVTVIRLDEQE